MPKKQTATEIRGFCSIGEYLQGPGIFMDLPHYAGKYGSVTVALIDPYFKALGEELTEKFSAGGQTLHVVLFSGQCSEEEIERVTGIASDVKASCIVGIGGGKTLDTARAVSPALNIAEILCVTSASCDAPTSSHSVVYKEDHTCRAVVHNKHPEYVLVDTDIVIQAPPRLLAAGIGDALATYFEAVTTQAANNVNNFGDGYAQTLTGMSIAKLCFETLLAKGEEAYQANCVHLRTKAFEDIVEANTLMSGLGTENTGCNISHGVSTALATIRDTFDRLHGETVTYGVLCQLIVENAPTELFDRVYRLCKNVGLPVCLADLNITENVEEKLHKAFEYAVANKEILWIPIYPVTADILYNAAMYVDSLKDKY